MNNRFIMYRNICLTILLLPLCLVGASVLSTNKPSMTLMYFGSKSCAACQQMEKTTFRDENLKKAIDNSVSFVKIDADTNRQLVRRWKVELLPTTFLIKDSNNKTIIIKKWMGIIDAQTILSALNEEIKRDW